jgi:hypothetical protein
MLAFAFVALFTGSISVNFGKVFIIVGIYQTLFEPGSIAIWIRFGIQVNSTYSVM